MVNTLAAVASWHCGVGPMPVTAWDAVFASLEAVCPSTHLPRWYLGVLVKLAAGRHACVSGHDYLTCMLRQLL